MSHQESPQPTSDLKPQLEYLATELLDWVRYDEGTYDDHEHHVRVLDDLLTGNGMLEIIIASRCCVISIDSNLQWALPGSLRLGAYQSLERFQKLIHFTQKQIDAIGDPLYLAIVPVYALDE